MNEGLTTKWYCTNASSWYALNELAGDAAAVERAGQIDLHHGAEAVSEPRLRVVAEVARRRRAKGAPAAAERAVDPLQPGVAVIHSCGQRGRCGEKRGAEDGARMAARLPIRAPLRRSRNRSPACAAVWRAGMSRPRAPSTRAASNYASARAGSRPWRSAASQVAPSTVAPGARRSDRRGRRCRRRGMRRRQSPRSSRAIRKARC